MPTVAMIDGFCLGGGLELVLACRYRVAEDGPKNAFRFTRSEIGYSSRLGWHCAYATINWCACKALNMVLSGHTVSGKAAAKLGFVDVAVPKRHLVNAAKYYILKHQHHIKPTSLQTFTNKYHARQIIGEISCVNNYARKLILCIIQLLFRY